MPVDRWQQLDDKRYDDPAAVVAEVARLIAERRFDRRELYRALAVSASAHRLMGELDVAHRQLAFAFVEARDRPEALGDLLQRFSYVVADRGDHFGAYRLTQRAMRAHSFTGDRVGVGKALVDQGLWLERLGRVEVAVMAFEAALKHWLPRGEWPRSRMTALQGLAVCHQKLGRPRLAAKFLERALASGARLGGLERAKLVAFQGTVAKDAGEYGEAEGFLEAALEQYRGVPSPLDWALVSVELVRGTAPPGGCGGGVHLGTADARAGGGAQAKQGRLGGGVRDRPLRVWGEGALAGPGGAGARGAGGGAGGGGEAESEGRRPAPAAGQPCGSMMGPILLSVMLALL